MSVCNKHVINVAGLPARSQVTEQEASGAGVRFKHLVPDLFFQQISCAAPVKPENRETRKGGIRKLLQKNLVPLSKMNSEVSSKMKVIFKN